MKCPECKRPLRWVGDEIFEEDTYTYLETVLDCCKCNIDVIKKNYTYNKETDLK